MDNISRFDAGEPIPGEGTQGSLAFELKAILMILTRDNLGESHISDEIIPLLEFLLGDKVSDIEDTESLQSALQEAAGIITEQYPHLRTFEGLDGAESSKLADLLLLHVPDAQIELVPGTEADQ